MFLLDTNTLSELLKGHRTVIERLNSLPEDAKIVIPVIARNEILEGRFASVRKAANGTELLTAAKRLTRDEAELATLEMIGVDEAVALQFESHVHNKKLKKIGRNDILIACIALAHGAIVVTRNTKDFEQFHNLQVENWID